MLQGKEGQRLRASIPASECHSASSYRQPIGRSPGRYSKVKWSGMSAFASVRINEARLDAFSVLLPDAR